MRTRSRSTASACARGTDVFKALALGADAVLVGRPVLGGLAIDGEAGAGRVLTLLRDELSDAMALSGRPELSAVDGGAVARLPGWRDHHRAEPRLSRTETPRAPSDREGRR